MVNSKYIYIPKHGVVNKKQIWMCLTFTPQLCHNFAIYLPRIKFVQIFFFDQ